MHDQNKIFGKAVAYARMEWSPDEERFMFKTNNGAGFKVSQVDLDVMDVSVDAVIDCIGQLDEMGIELKKEHGYREGQGWLDDGMVLVSKLDPRVRCVVTLHSNDKGKDIFDQTIMDEDADLNLTWYVDNHNEAGEGRAYTERPATSDELQAVDKARAADKKEESVESILGIEGEGSRSLFEDIKTTKGLVESDEDMKLLDETAESVQELFLEDWSIQEEDEKKKFEQPFDLDDSVEDFLKRHNLDDQIIREGDMARLTPEAAKDLQHSYDVFMNGEASEEYKREAEATIEEIARKALKTFKVKAEIEWTGPEGTYQAKISVNDGEPEDIEGLRYSDYGSEKQDQVAVYEHEQGSNDWHWIAWLADVDSPFEDSDWADAYNETDAMMWFREIMSYGEKANEDAIIAAGKKSMQSEVEESITEESDKRYNEPLASYLVTAMWSSSDDDGTPLDQDYDLDDIHQDSVDKSEKELNHFIEKAGDLLDGEDMERVAHDFWLTRNGHGAGFWDGDYEKEKGEKLSDLSNKYGTVDILVGDDGKLHFEGGHIAEDVKKKTFDQEAIERLSEDAKILKFPGAKEQTSGEPVKINPALQRKYANMDKSDLLNLMTKFQRERNEAGSIDNMPYRQVRDGHAIFSALADAAETEELRKLSLAYIRNLEAEMRAHPGRKMGEAKVIDKDFGKSDRQNIAKRNQERESGENEFKRLQDLSREEKDKMAKELFPDSDAMSEKVQEIIDLDSHADMVQILEDEYDTETTEGQDLELPYWLEDRKFKGSDYNSILDELFMVVPGLEDWAKDPKNQYLSWGESGGMMPSSDANYPDDAIILDIFGHDYEPSVQLEIDQLMSYVGVDKSRKNDFKKWLMIVAALSDISVSKYDGTSDYLWAYGREQFVAAVYLKFDEIKQMVDSLSRAAVGGKVVGGIMRGGRKYGMSGPGKREDVEDIMIRLEDSAGSY